MKTRTTSAWAVLVAAVLVLAVACGDDSSGTSQAPPGTSPAPSGSSPSADPYAPQPLPVRAELVFSTSGNFEFIFPVHLAKLKGEFAKENLDVEIATIPANAQIQGLGTGDADILGIGASATALNAVDQGIGLMFFLNSAVTQNEGSSQGMWVNKDRLTPSGELDPAKVDGMKIILGTQGAASPTVYVLQQMLEEVGKSVEDVEITVLDPGADSLAALQNGSVNGGHLLSPFSDDPKLKECCAHLQASIPAGKYAADATDLAERPEVYEAFVRALIRTNRTYLQGNYHTDPEVSTILAEFTGAPLATVQGATSWYDFGNEARNDDELLEELQAMWLGVGGILGYENPIPIDDYSTQEIVDAVNG